jgi:hypothetical protein
MGCHIVCEKYLAFRKEREAAYAKNAQQAEVTAFVGDVKRNVQRRYGGNKKC